MRKYRGEIMEVSYKKLWKLLIDKDMKKKDLQEVAGISWTSVTKLSKGETVSMDVLMKVCKALNCDISDIVEFIDATDKEQYQPFETQINTKRKE